MNNHRPSAIHYIIDDPLSYLPLRRTCLPHLANLQAAAEGQERGQLVGYVGGVLGRLLHLASYQIIPAIPQHVIFT